MTGALDRLRTTAKSLIDKFGKQVSLVRESTTYNPATGQTTTTSTSTAVNATPPKDFTAARIDGTLIQQGDTVIQISPLDFTPQPADKVTIDSSIWKIVQIGKVYSGEQIALYTLHLRK